MTSPLMTKLLHYIALIEKVDLFCTRVKTDCKGSLACRLGCDSCCSHLTLFPVEAVHLRLAMAACPEDLRKIIAENAEAQMNNPAGPCPLLQDGGCLLYEARPMICRTHGYPILVDDGEGKRVDHCPLNFRSGETILRRHILDLDTLNTTLTAINGLFIKEGPGCRELSGRILMAQALLMDLQDDGPGK